jgi:hypothetical protein
MGETWTMQYEVPLMVTLHEGTPYTWEDYLLSLKLWSTKWYHRAMASQLDLGDFLGNVLDNLIHIEFLHWREGAWHIQK